MRSLFRDRQRVAFKHDNVAAAVYRPSGVRIPVQASRTDL
jgi:hypothetical protein